MPLRGSGSRRGRRSITGRARTIRVLTTVTGHSAIAAVVRDMAPDITAWNVLRFSLPAFGRPPDQLRLRAHERRCRLEGRAP